MTGHVPILFSTYCVKQEFAVWSGTSYSRIHFLPFTRDGRGYAQHTPFTQSLELSHMREKPTSAYGSLYILF